MILRGSSLLSVGDDGTITPAFGGLQFDILALHSTAAGELWLGGARGQLARLDGEQWTSVPTGRRGDIVAISSNAFHIWVAIDGHDTAEIDELLHFDGIKWVAVSLPGDLDVRDLRAVDAGVFLATSQGILLSTDNGASWQPALDGDYHALWVNDDGSFLAAAGLTDALVQDELGLHPFSLAGAIIDFVGAGNQVWALGDHELHRYSAQSGWEAVAGANDYTMNFAIGVNENDPTDVWINNSRSRSLDGSETFPGYGMSALLVLDTAVLAGGPDGILVRHRRGGN